MSCFFRVCSRREPLRYDRYKRPIRGMSIAYSHFIHFLLDTKKPLDFARGYIGGGD